MQKRYLLLSLFLLASTAFASSLPSYPFIHVNGRAAIVLAPNVGEIDFELTELSENPQFTFQKMLDHSNDVFDFLKSENIIGEDVEAGEIKKYVSSVEYQDAAVGEKKYRLIRDFHVVVKDFSQWNRVVSGLLQKSYLGNFNVKFGRNDMPRIQQDLFLMASADAANNAQLLAKSFSVKLGNAAAISNTPIKTISTTMGLDGPIVAENLVADLKPVSRDLGAPSFLKFQQTIDVIYKLK